MSRGRGRGRGSSMSFNIEAIGFGRGDALPAAIVQPPPDYPPLKSQPVQLLRGEDQSYLFSVQQKHERRLRNTPYYVRKQVERNVLERYSDKYKKTTHSDDVLGWEVDWNRIPEELKIVKKKKKVAPKIKKIKLNDLPDEEIKKKFEELDKNDAENSEQSKKKDDDKEEGSDVEIEVEDIEEDEEDNDYMNAHFDNGESYLDEEEDALEDKDGGIY